MSTLTKRESSNFLETGKYPLRLISYKDEEFRTPGGKAPGIKMEFEVFNGTKADSEDVGKKVNCVAWYRYDEKTGEKAVSGKSAQLLEAVQGESEADIGTDFDLDYLIGSLVWGHILGTKKGDKYYSNIDRLEPYDGEDFDEDDGDEEEAPKTKSVKKPLNKKQSSKKKEEDDEVEERPDGDSDESTASSDDADPFDDF